MSIAPSATWPATPGGRPPVGVPASLRLVQLPDIEAPFDEPVPETGRVLRLLPRPSAAALHLLPPLPEPRHLRLLADLEDEPHCRTVSAELPPARPFAFALVQRLLEVLAGVRPVAQLQRDTSLDVFDRLGALVAAQPRHRGPRPDRRAIRSLHIQQRPDGVAEVCATVHRGQRFAALALRLEGVDGRWTCMHLDGV